MILYLLIIVILLIGIYVYDIRGARNGRNHLILLVSILLICVSGFAYRIGGDGIIYLNEWKQYGDITDLNTHYIFSFGNRQPGWVLLNMLCKTVTDSYWFFKLVHAIILNTAYVYTIRRNTKYVFSGLLVFFVLIYFNQNFQILRESLAIAFFFVALPSFYNNHWKRYLFWVLIAISFHVGAAFFLLLPLVKLIGFNKYSIVVYIAAFIALIMFSSRIVEFLMVSSNENSDLMNGNFYYYFHNANSDNSFSLLNLLLNVFIPFSILLYYKRHDVNVKYFYPALASIVIYVLSSFLPIVYRFNNYLLIFNYLLITDFIFRWFMAQKVPLSNKAVFIGVVFLVFVGFKARFYFTEYGETKFKQYVQYYPYASVFEKYEDPQREIFYSLLH